MKITVDELSGTAEMCRRNDSGDFVLTIKDSASHIPVVEVTLTPERLADLLSSRVTGDSVPMRLWLTDKHGKKRTTKTVNEMVTVPVAGDATKELQIAAAKLQDKNPEWEVEVPRTWNHHSASHYKKEEDNSSTYVYLFRMTRYV